MCVCVYVVLFLTDSGLFLPFILFLKREGGKKRVMELDGWRGGEDLGGDSEKETEVRICFMKQHPNYF